MGASTLTIPISRALPKPPDVAAEGSVPGGVLVPVTPDLPNEPIARRNNWRLVFPFTQGYQLTVRRIHVVLPVRLRETTLDIQVTQTTSKLFFKTAAERVEYEEGKEGLEIANEGISPISYSAPYEKREASIAHEANVRTMNVKTTMAVERSVLPLTMTIVVRLYGPEGQVWSESYEVPVHYAKTAGDKPGNYAGTGIIDAYADLVNGLVIDPDQASAYSMEILLLVPTSVKTDARVGVEVKEEFLVEGTQGAVTFFYDVDPAPVGK